MTYIHGTDLGHQKQNKKINHHWKPEFIIFLDFSIRQNLEKLRSDLKIIFVIFCESQ